MIGASTPTRFFRGWKLRFFITARWAWTPYREISAYLPVKGRVLDLGCGHGLMSFALGESSSHREVCAIDHDESRISLARNAFRHLSHLRFQVGDFSILNQSQIFDGIVLMDVLHYFPKFQQKEILEKSFARLTQKGVLVFREVNPDAGLKSTINKFYERLMLKCGFTKAQELYFRPVNEWENLAREAGFDVSSRPLSRFPFSDVLFVCKKPDSHVSHSG